MTSSDAVDLERLLENYGARIVLEKLAGMCATRFSNRLNQGYQVKAEEWRAKTLAIHGACNRMSELPL